MSEGSKSAGTRDRQDGASRPGESGNDGPGASEQDDTTERREGAASESADPRPAPGDDPGETEGAGAREGLDADEEPLASQLEAARAELAEQKDRYLRAVAEAENIRRRADNDIASARKYAIEGFASEILAVRDSLEIARSLDIRENDADAVAKMKEGLDLTLKQLDGTLSKFSIETVDPREGDKLDPERHQAMSTQESGNVPPNHILSVIQKGYMIHGRLLRPAMVVVAKKPQSETQTESETA